MKHLFIILTLFISSQLFAQIPSGYYDDASGLEGSALKSALHNIIDNHTEVSYTALKTYLKDTDEDPNNSNNIILFYTGRSQSKSSFGGDPNDWNREHVWAKSHGDFGNNPPYGTDLHQMRPTDASVNSDRGNKDFAEGGTQHSEATGCYYTSNTWEPRDEVKGDVARIIMYMAVRYEGDNGELDLEAVDYNANDSNPEFGILSTLLEWNRNDPPDAFEMNRHEVVYGIQHNRNPFIDHPEWADCIWASCSSIRFTSDAITNAQENSTYTYNITYEVSNNTETITCPTKPAWLTFTANTASNTATLSGTPSATDIGNHNISLKLEENGEIVYQNFTINVIAASAPVTIFNKDFEDDNLTSGGWTSQSVIGSQVWGASSYNSSHYGKISGYVGGTPYANEDWFISPTVNLNNYYEEVLTFNSAYNYGNSSVDPKLKYSTNYNSGSPSSATWTDLSFTLPAGDSWNWVNSGDIDVSSITGTNVNFAFIYYASNSNAPTWEIDNILLKGKNVSSISNINKNKINIYPNPVTNKLFIKSGKIILGLNIVNILGQTVNNYTNINSKNNELNLENLNKGIYIINVIDIDGNNNIIKFIKK